MQVIPQNHEWLKILVSTLAGLCTGLIADPIRKGMQWRLDVLRMQRAIVLDCIMLMTACEVLKVGLVPDEKFWLAIDLPAFEHYWNKSREMFYDRQSLRLTAMHCQRMLFIKTKVINGEITSEDGRNQLMNTLDDIRKTEPKIGFFNRRIRRFLSRNMWK